MLHNAIHVLLLSGLILLPVTGNSVDVLSVSGKTPYAEEAQAMKGQFRKLTSDGWNFHAVSGNDLVAEPGILDRQKVIVFGREHNTWEKAGLEAIESKLKSLLENGAVVLIDTASVADNRWFEKFPLAADLAKTFSKDFVFEGVPASSGFSFPNQGAIPENKSEMKLGPWRVYGDNGKKGFFCAIREFSGGGTLAVLPRFASPELLENLVVRSMMKKNGLPEVFSLRIPPLRYGNNTIAVSASAPVGDILLISFRPDTVKCRFSTGKNVENTHVFIPSEGILGAELSVMSGKNVIYRKPLSVNARPLLYLYPKLGWVTAGDPTEIQGVLRSAEPLSFPLRGTWVLKSAANNVVLDSGKVDITSSRFHFQVRTPKDGYGKLKAELRIGAPEAVASCEFNTRPATAKPPAIAFRADRTMLVNGTPVFPIWGSRVDNAQIPELAAMGFNFITDMKQFSQMGSKNYRSGDEIRAGEFIGRHGMKKMAMLNWEFSEKFGKLHGAEFGETFRKELPLWRGDSNILIHYLMDEPPPSMLDTVAAGYRMLKEIDPDRPVAVCLNHLERPELAEAIRKAGRFADIVMVDPYPYPYRGIDTAERQLRLARELTGKDTPLMYWMQGFAYSTDRSKKDLGRYPTRDELRCEAFLAICHDARGLGVFTMTWLDIGRIDLSRRAFWNAMRQVIGEVKEFTPMLLSEMHRAGGRYENLPLHTFQSCCNGDLYLVVVNSSASQLKVRIELPGLTNGNPVDEFFESRLLFPADSAIRDSFSPLGVHAYRIPGCKKLESVRLYIEK